MSDYHPLNEKTTPGGQVRTRTATDDLSSYCPRSRGLRSCHTVTADVPLAVVGLACRFPGARDRDTYWRNVLDDVYSIAPMPASRFHRERYYDPEVGAYAKTYSELGGLLEERPFDPSAFRIPPKVAAATDVAQLWALEVARDTLADAGLAPDGLAGEDCGVIIGHARGSMLTSDMAFGTAIEGLVPALDRVPGLADAATVRTRTVAAIHAAYPQRTEDGGTGTIASALAGRIASSFGLTGKHAVVDAACASSFAALDLAARSVRSGRMKLALVGGASYSQELSVILFAQSRALSGEGSFPFDKRASGFISSDGIGFLLICRVDEAVRRGWKIQALIRGVAGACDGKGKALWAPRKEGQILAMERAYAQCGLVPSSIGLVEAHATSTPIGDATEIQALHHVFAPHLERGRRLPVGSVKGNIGHCREAAGVAGLIKSIEAIRHATIPPTGNFREPSEEIPWDEVAVEVSTSARPWTAPADGGPRRAAVNAFGIGGLNYHVLVEEAPTTPSVRGAELEAPRPRPPIAIVGVGLRVPGAHRVEDFWRDLLAGRDVFVDAPAERWSRDVYFQAGERAPYRTYTTRGAFITDFEADWRRYRVPPKLVERNDPLQFMLLESALDAFEDARLDPDSIDRKRVAVLMGTVFGSDYALDLSLSIRALELGEVAAEQAGRPGDRALIDAITDTVRATLPSINEDSSGSFSSSTLASRVAKTLDLMGPTYTLDAACASSFASLEAACDLLADGDVDVAVYGGGDRAMRVQRYEAYCQFGAISRGEPRPFDARADGFLPGEGAAVCVLMRLDDAVARGLPVRAIVRGVGSSSDGERKSLHKPSAEGLGLAMRRALDAAAIDPATVGYVECHGGGTPSGDATEVAALRASYLAPELGRRAPLTIGTVKSNLGHTQGAAGAVAMAKVVLALQHGELPPTRGFETPHPDHHFEAGLRVNTAAEPFPGVEGAPRRAAVSAMGLGGVNYHVILEAGPDASAAERHHDDGDRPAEPVTDGLVHTLRAPDGAALKAALGTTDPERLFAEKRLGRGPAVATIVAASARELAERLATAKKAALVPGTRAFLARQGAFARAAPPAEAPRVALLFSGQGSQFPGMMARLAEELPAVRAVAERFDRALAARGRAPLAAGILAGAPIPEEVFAVQASILFADVAAWTALDAIGVRPSLVTGHSFGDYAALVAAGAWSLETAIDATHARSEAIEATVRPGGMLGVMTDAARVREVLARLGPVGVLEPSNLNAPKQTVVSGEPEALAAAVDAFAAEGVETRRLPIPRAFHSSLMAAARDRLAESLAGLPLEAPRLRYLSSVTGTEQTEPAEIRAALVEQLTRPVDFVAQIRALRAAGCDVLIEAGPKGVLAGLARQTVEADERDADVDVLTTDDSEQPGRWALARVQASLQSRAPDDGRAETAAAESTAPEPELGPRGLELLDAEESARLREDPRFEAFWSRTRPVVQQLLRGLWAAERGPEAEAPAEAGAVAEAPAEEATEAAPSVPREEIERFLVGAICEETGYPPDLIEMDADLEADLGIDTVKQAQVLGKVRDRYGLKTDQNLSLRDFPSLGHILEYVSGQLASQQPRRKKARLVPMVDVTARRTRRPQIAEPLPHPIADGPAPSAPPSTVRPSADPGSIVRAAPPPPPPAPRRPKALPATGAASLGGVSLEPVVQAPPPPRGSSRPSSARPTNGHGRVETDDPGPSFEPPPPPRAGRVERVEAAAEPPRPSMREVRVLELSGTAREIGRAHGEATRADVRDLIDRYEAFLGARGLTMTSVPDAIRILPTLFDEAALEEIRGVAEAVDLPFEFLLAYNLDTALFPAFTTGCTQAVRTAATNGGTLLHLVNEDSPLRLHLGGAHPRVVQIRRRSDGPAPERTVVSFSLAGQIFGPNAVNDAGLTITSCALLDRAPPLGLPEGLPHPQVVKRMAEGAGSLPEAMKLAREARRSGRWSLLVSDGDRDEAAYLEYDGDAILLEGRVPGVWVSSNHAIAGPAPGQSVPEHSTHRGTRAGALIRTDQPLDVPAAQAALRDRFDRERGREVDHPTMNTVRRVDNVMSLVVEGRARRLYVTDRTDVPGGPGAETDSCRFLRVDYGSPGGPGGSGRPREGADPDASTEATERPASAPAVDGLAPVSEVMRRHVVRVLPEEAPDATGRFAPEAVLLIGDDERTEALAAALSERGAKVTLREDAADALAELDALGGPAAFDALGIVLPAIEDKRAWALDAETWAARRAAAVDGPFALLRAWCPVRAELGRPTTIFGVTLMGGALGFDNVPQGAPDGGALIGLLKAVRREFDGFQVQALDLSPSTGGAQAARALLAELDAGSPRLEVGQLRKTRVRLALAPQPAEGWAGGTAHLPASWLITGGARGVTAKVAERLAGLYQPRLHLLGRHRLPSEAELERLAGLDEAGIEAEKQATLERLRAAEGFSPKVWKDACEALDKTLEVQASLQAMRAAGSIVHYHAVDVSDADALAAVLEAVRAEGPIEGLIHGAGYELAKPFDKKDDAILARTLGGKLDGLLHLLRLTAGDPLSHVVAFSSVSGRFGGHGQTDYSMANEALARWMGTYRAGRESVRTAVLSWPAWAEVGLAARDSSRVFLERTGQKFMSPAEGANHVVRELFAGLPEPEVVICERLDALDLDRILPVEDEVPRWRELDRRAQRSPMLEHVVYVSGTDQRVAERSIAAEEPFLDQHRMGPTPLLPAVIGLEMMAELLALDGGRFTIGEVEIETPLKVRPGQPAGVRITRDGDALRVTAAARRPDGVVLEPDRVHLRGRRLEPRPIPERSLPPWSGEPSPFPYPRQYDRSRGSRLMFHGPVFRCLEGVLPGEGGGLARLIVPPVEALVPGTSAGAWLLPAALLDGCLQAAGLLGRILYDLSALPIGFGRVDVAPRAVRATGEVVTLEVRIRPHGEDQLISDLYAVGEHGPLLHVEGYRSQVMRGL